MSTAEESADAFIDVKSTKLSKAAPAALPETDGDVKIADLFAGSFMSYRLRAPLTNAILTKFVSSRFVILTYCKLEVT